MLLNTTERNWRLITGEDKSKRFNQIIKEHERQLQKKIQEQSVLRNTEEYQDTLRFLKKTLVDTLKTLRIWDYAASRNSTIAETYLFPIHRDDLVEALLVAVYSIENGALNAARRQLRFVLELVVNILYVDEEMAACSRDEKVKYYFGSRVKKRNVDNIRCLPLRLLGEHKEEFANLFKTDWINATNYVHHTKRRLEEKLYLMEQGYSPGFESLEMLEEVVDEVYRVCSIIVILALETIGPSATGDLMVLYFEDEQDWVFHKNGYIAIIDRYYDYKAERKGKVAKLEQRRKSRVIYHAELL